MNKKELLEGITKLAATNDISKADILHAFDKALGDTTNSLTKKFGIAEILYYIGGLIVFLGIALLVTINWDELSSLTKLLITLGSGVASYIVGVLFSREKKLESVGQAFYLISAMVNPIGISVAFNLAGYDVETTSIHVLIFAILFGTYLSSYLFFKKTLFLLFSIIFGTGLFFSGTAFLIGSNPVFVDWQFTEYRILAIGMSYLLLGHYFSGSDKKALTGPLYGFGSLFFLGAALLLGKWTPNQNIVWELLFPGLALGIIFLSTYLKSKSLLVFGSIFLMIYILKITSEYFSEGLGWPFALILAGLALIAIGYYSIQINKKYFSHSL